MVTESEDDVDFHKDFKIPRTLEEDLLYKFEREKNKKRGCFELLVNGIEHRSIGGSRGNLAGKHIKINVKFPEEFNDKKLDFIKYEFQQLEENIEIREVALVKKVDSRECLIQEKHTVPVNIGLTPFEFIYKDAETNEEESLIIRNLFFGEVDEDRRGLFSCKENEKMLCGIISANESIRNLEIFTKNRLNGGINYTMAPMVLTNKTRNPEDEHLMDHELYIGFIDPKKKEVDIVLFSILKKLNNVYKTVLYER